MSEGVTGSPSPVPSEPRAPDSSGLIDDLKRPPPKIPDHELLQQIGRGAYGEVWLARSVMGTLRAVKVVYRQTFSDAHPFEREFKGIQKFEPVSRSHDGLIDILQIGRNDAEGYFYYVMELAEGVDRSAGVVECWSDGKQQSLHHSRTPTLQHSASYSPRTLRHDLRTRGRLPIDECLTLGLALTSALEHLHKNGLVHRDVKPSNIVFVNGRPKLADIGLVTEIDEAHSLVGTVGYLAPDGAGTPQADLYSLGKVLYESAFGKQAQEFPQLPADLPSRTDHRRLLELNEIIARACASHAEERYTSAADMGADLARLQRGQSIRTRRAFERVLRVAKRTLPLAALLAVLSVVFVNQILKNTRQSSAPAEKASIFILPFRNEGTNGNDNGLAARATDAFIDSLKLINGVTVAPRREELGRRPEAEARAEAAKLFAVRYVLSGNVKTGDTNTLALTLHDLASDRMVWSQSFTGVTVHFVQMEVEAIHATAKALRLPITTDAEQHIGQTLSNNLAAWQLVQQADKVSFLGRDSVSAALQQYNEALQLDRDYAGALAGKAFVIRNLSGDRPPNEIWPEIKSCGGRMLQIDPTSSRGQSILWETQFLFEWDWDGAEKVFQERRSRHLDLPVLVACYLRMVGRFDEARVEQEKVKGLDQRNIFVRQHSTAAAFVDRDYRQTIEEAQKTQAVFPKSLYGLDWLFHGYYHLGQFEKALDTVRKRRRIFDEPLCRALEACALAKLGKRESAREFLTKLEAQSADRYVDAYPLAWIHLALGDKATALAKLRKACGQHSEFLVLPDSLAGGLRTDPKLDELREEPEFQELLKLVGLDVWPR